MSNVFISYRREDSGGYALALGRNLRQRLDEERVFMDIESIEPGVDFVEVIEKAVGSCVVLLAVIGPQWLSVSNSAGRRLDDPDDFVALEIASALERGIRVIPVLINHTPMPAEDDLPDRLKSLARRNALELSSTRFDADLDRLVATIERVLEAEEERRAAEAKASPFGKHEEWVRDVKLEMGRLIDRENLRPLPSHLAALLPTTMLDVVLREELVRDAEPIIDRVQAALNESCRRHGLLYDRTYHARLWGNGDPDAPLFAISAHAEDRSDPDCKGPTGKTLDGELIPSADPGATQLVGDRPVAWDPGRWLLMADLGQHGQQAFRLTDPVSTVGRASDDLESLATCVLKRASRSISRRQVAFEWEARGPLPGFRVYNLGAASIQAGEEPIPGAKVGRTKADLRALKDGHSAWLPPGDRVTIGESGPVLWVEEITSL